MIFKKSCFLLVLILLLTLAASGFSFAEGGEGGGQNQEEPLILAHCNISDGLTEVPVDTAIQLEFSKNVVNMAVSEKNKKCITLSGENGSNVPLKVQMGDDQIDPSIKRIITVIPESPLTAGAKYDLRISGELRAKSGAVLGSPIVIAFQTAGISDTDGAAASKKQEIGEPPESGSLTAGAISSGALSEGNAENADTNGRNRDIPKKGIEPLQVFSAGCFTAAAILLVLYIVKRRKT